MCVASHDAFNARSAALWVEPMGVCPLATPSLLGGLLVLWLSEAGIIHTASSKGQTCPCFAQSVLLPVGHSICLPCAVTWIPFKLKHGSLALILPMVS